MKKWPDSFFLLFHFEKKKGPGPFFAFMSLRAKNGNFRFMSLRGAKGRGNLIRRYGSSSPYIHAVC